MKEETLAFAITNGATYLSGTHDVDTGRIRCQLSFSSQDDLMFVTTNLWRFGWYRVSKSESSVSNIWRYSRSRRPQVTFRAKEDLELKKNGIMVYLTMD